MVGDGVVGMDFSGTEVAEIFPIWESQHTSFIKPFSFFNSSVRFGIALAGRITQHAVRSGGSRMPIAPGFQRDCFQTGERHGD